MRNCILCLDSWIMYPVAFLCLVGGAKGNEAPVLNNSVDLTATAVDEDTSAASNSGTLVSKLLQSGANNNPISDTDGTQVSESGGQLTQLSVTNGGSNYNSAPAVTIQNGGGSGATATASIAVDGPVTSLNISSGGSGYSSAPTLTFSGGGGSGASATATLTFSGGAVTAITVNASGGGYTSAPTVTLTGGGGSGATATATIGEGRVTAITVNNGGALYSSAPTVNIAASVAPAQSTTFDPTVIWTSGGGSTTTGTYTSSNHNLKIVSDNLPNPAPYGTFPNAQNPNTVTAQSYSHTFIYRGGHNIAATSHTSTPLGSIAIAANGAVIYNASAASGGNPPSGYNYAAPEANLFGEDQYGGHPQQNGQYHYHDTHMLDAFIATGSVYDSNSYYNSSNYAGDSGRYPDGHSKIVAFSYDGYPVYGPYGYNNPIDSSSGVQRMTSSFQVVSSRPAGGPSTTTYPLGIFIQDYQYVAGLGTLDQYNGRFCVTPEFPGGTYAYFLSMNSSSKPVYPYMIGPQYYGDPVAYGSSPPSNPTWETSSTGSSSVSTISGSVTGLTLNSGGSGYTSNPSISFSGGGGSGAAGTTAITTTGRVASLSISDAGSLYTTAPDVVFDNTGTGGSGVTATATVSAIATTTTPIQGIAVTALNGNGTWQFSTDGGSNWSSVGPVAENSARLLASDGSTAIRFMPGPAWFGTASLSYRAWDQTSGVNGGLFDASINGGSTAFSSAEGTANLVVNRVSDLPALVSGPTAVPSPAGTGQAVTFAVTASDHNQDALTYAWSFGDGSSGTGASVTHAYAAAGTYKATVTITDAQDGSITSSTSVAINAPVVGQGNDSDGDGFSDSFEIAAGTDPNSAASTPTGQSASAATVSPLSVTKAAITLNFTGGGKDSILFGGTMNIPAGFNPNNSVFQLDVAGISKSIVLTSKGSSAEGNDSVKIAIKSGTGGVPAQTAKYLVALTKGSYAAMLASVGLTGDADVKSVPRPMTFTVIFNNTIYQAMETLNYTARKGKSGVAK